MQTIDIRSDTVTGPTEKMRKAMAEAEVGDDVYGDDPTINRLEKTGAKLLGKEAALFVPSGTFGNQLALFTHCPRGTEVVLGEECHIIQHEAGAASIISGVQTRTIPAPDGVFTGQELLIRLRKRDLHAPPTSLICLENAHSMGKTVSLAVMDEVRNITNEWNLPVHLDGARIFNAATALGCSAADIAKRCDSVMFCLSKGLCAPVGSLLVGGKSFIEEARLKRKIMGGGMRQAGILAAAGLIALTEHPLLLADDHKRARELEKALAEIPGISVDEGNINMVFFRWVAEKESARALVNAFRSRGIIINDPEQKILNGKTELLFRFVTHHWIGDKEAEAIIEACRFVFRHSSAGFDGSAKV
ncbi:MAG: aminotransferase class I/II-fold pyridoxal phosphate-dependent enzyme [Treponema sp.]|nr:aminotransferase class I/II-fold pyridoxal phosphate-dependent enzyme [Treponema sp.]